MYDNKLLLNDHETAKLLGISRASLWRHCASGNLPAPIRIVGSTRWRRDELMDAIEQISVTRQGEGP